MIRTGELFYKVASQQIIAFSILSLAFGLLDKPFGVSWFLGSSVAILPQYVFTRWVFRYRGAKAIANIVSSLYQAEVIKFIMTALLFILVLTQIKNLNPWAFFIAFLMAIFSHWLLALRSSKKK